MSTREPHVLLEILGLWVERERMPAGLTGTVAIGVVLTEGDEQWLRVKMGKRCEVEHLDREPEADGALRLTERDATAIVTTGSLSPRPVVSMQGDGALVRRFIERYTSQRSWLSVRCAQAT